MKDSDNDAEHRLAVLTSWGLFGAFGLGVVLSGFRADDLRVVVAGYGLFAAGYIAHLVINRIYDSGFRPGEIATAIVVFGVATLAFMANWAFDPAFTETDVLAGIIGLALAVGGFVATLATRFGLKGSFSMFHIHRES